MRQLSRTDAPALRALACLCLSDPSNPVNPGYGVDADDVGKFLWPDAAPFTWAGGDDRPHAALMALQRLRAAGYVRMRSSFSPPRFAWQPTARGWQAALMPTETVDQRA